MERSSVGIVRNFGSSRVLPRIAFCKSRLTSRERRKMLRPIFMRLKVVAFHTNSTVKSASGLDGKPDQLVILSMIWSKSRI